MRAVVAARGRTILPEHLDAEPAARPGYPRGRRPIESLPLPHLLADVEQADRDRHFFFFMSGTLINIY